MRHDDIVQLRWIDDLGDLRAQRPEAAPEHRVDYRGLVRRDQKHVVGGAGKRHAREAWIVQMLIR